MLRRAYERGGPREEELTIARFSYDARWLCECVFATQLPISPVPLQSNPCWRTPWRTPVKSASYPICIVSLDGRNHMYFHLTTFTSHTPPHCSVLLDPPKDLQTRVLLCSPPPKLVDMYVQSTQLGAAGLRGHPAAARLVRSTHRRRLHSVAVYAGGPRLNKGFSLLEWTSALVPQGSLVTGDCCR